MKPSTYSLPTTLTFLLLTLAQPNSSSANPNDTNQPATTNITAPQEDPQPRRSRTRDNNIYKANIEPNWFSDNNKFWYRNALPRERSEFIVVDAEQGTRNPAFNHRRLANALAEASNTEVNPRSLPFNHITFIEDNSAIIFDALDKTWRCDLTNYSCAPFETKAENNDNKVEENPGETNNPRQSRRRGEGRQNETISPDGQFSAFIRNHNVHIRERNNDETITLTNDGSESNSYGNIEWSPNSTSLIAWRTEPAERKHVHIIQSSPPEGGRAIHESRPYVLPGDPFPKREPNVFNISDKSQTKPEVDRFEHEWLSPQIQWSNDGERFMYHQIDRGHQRFRVIEINTTNGNTRYLVDEKTETFIWTHHTENLGLGRLIWLDNSEEFICASEMDGWRHLYLIDIPSNTMHPITTGEWVVRGINHVDEENRQIWFTASGFHPNQDPYFIHHFRINFDGSNLTPLTEANGNHNVQYSPDRRFLIATHSRVDSPPVSELRRTSDGNLITQLEEADIRNLIANGWEPPEVFVAKGRDGTTDIWGIIARPQNYDPDKRYPVIEAIYAGPQSSYVPKSFSPRRHFSSLTDLGFIVVKIDGMGTANRSKAFHDVAWHNLKDAGFPDRILWMKAAAEMDPGMDLTRVGIYGNSAGGQNAAGALLFHPDFYKAAVASCGCHDNRMDKASWNEQWMGYPVGPQYSESSNIDNAQNLQGHLLLIVGEMDTNVPPESTLRLVDALINANKDFDLLVIPNGGHGMGGAYGERRMQDFFLRHLTDNNPPNRNANQPPPPTPP